MRFISGKQAGIHDPLGYWANFLMIVPDQNCVFNLSVGSVLRGSTLENLAKLSHLTFLTHILLCTLISQPKSLSLLEVYWVKAAPKMWIFWRRYNLRCSPHTCRWRCKSLSLENVGYKNIPRGSVACTLSQPASLIAILIFLFLRTVYTARWTTIGLFVRCFGGASCRGPTWPLWPADG